MKKEKRRSGYRCAWLLLLVPLTLLLQLLCRSSPALTESIYSRHIYPVVSAVVSPVFGVLPFSAAEVILAALAVWLGWSIARGAIRFFRAGPSVLLHGLLKLAAFAGTVFFLFYAMWGFNYYRQPLSADLKLGTGAPTKAELSAVTNREIAAVNALCPQISYDKNGHSAYAGGFRAMCAQVNEGYGRYAAPQQPEKRFINRVYAWPKAIFPSSLMSYTGIEGIFVPFTYEPSVDTDYPAFVLPFDMSHEVAHFKGFAREDEANFLAYLACLSNPDVYFQYSGHMNALMYLSNALYETDQNLWKQDVSALDKRAARDLDFYNDYVQKHRSKAADVANQVNDDYLKAQGQPGVISYDNFVNLLCGQYRTNGK